jgi:hypothetical protein
MKIFFPNRGSSRRYFHGSRNPEKNERIDSCFLRNHKKNIQAEVLPANIMGMWKSLEECGND